MGLFTMLRRRVVAAEAGWLPTTQEIFTAPAEMFEGECAGEDAYGAQFAHALAPGALITIYAFAAECGPLEPDCFWVAYRADYMITPAGDWNGTWSDSIYCGDAGYSEWYGTAEAASESARQSAADLHRDGERALGLLQVADDTVTEWFDWDGQPW